MRFKKFVVLAAALLLSVSLAAAPETPKAEKTALVKELQRSQKLLHDSTKGLSPEQWSWKPAPDRWSVAECVEHLALAEDLLRSRVTDQVMTSPAMPGKKSAQQIQQEDAGLAKSLVDRSQKFQAPEQLRPEKSTFTSGPEALKAFDQRRAQAISWLKSEKETLRDHMADFPTLKDMDAHQWLLLISLHTERHTLQAKEVMADPKFPKKK